MASGLENTVDLGHGVHGVGIEMLDQLTAQNSGEVFGGIRERVRFSVEKIHFALELFAIRRAHALMRFGAGRAEIAGAHLAVAEPRFERGRDLEVSAHLEDAVIHGTGRREIKSAGEPVDVRCGVVLRRLFGGGPAQDVALVDGIGR